MIITAYNQHVRLLSSEPFGWFAPPKFTRVWEPTLFMESLHSLTVRKRFRAASPPNPRARSAGLPEQGSRVGDRRECPSLSVGWTPPTVGPLPSWVPHPRSGFPLSVAPSSVARRSRRWR